MSLKLSEEERDVRVELDRAGQYDHWLDIKQEDEDTYVVVKDDSKPTYNERRYEYKEKKNGFEFIGGEKSSSGTGEFQKTKPSNRLDSEIRRALKHVYVDGEEGEGDDSFEVPKVPRATRHGALNTAVKVLELTDKNYESTDQALVEVERLADNIVLDIEENSQEGQARKKANENHGGDE